MPVGSTSFSVRGEDASTEGEEAAGASTDPETATDPARIAITDGSSHDRREDLTPWMQARATTYNGNIPVAPVGWQQQRDSPRAGSAPGHPGAMAGHR